MNKMPTEEGHSGDTPIRSAVEIAMSGQRPMDSVKPAESPNNVPIQTALEKAMAGERPPISHNNREEVLPWNESQGSSQNNISLNDFTESLNPSKEKIVENFNMGMPSTPSIIVPTKIEDTPKIEPTIVNKDLSQEARESNDKRNEWFTGKHFSQTGQDALGSQDPISKIAKENASLQEQNKMLIEKVDKIQAALDKLTGASTPYQQNPALAAALDPNKVKPLNPLEEVQQKLLKEQEQKQIDFAKQVAEEDKLHNPLNPEYSPNSTPNTPEVISKTPEQAKKERRLKTAAFIAGAVVGTAGGIMGGTPTSLIGVAACTVLGYASRGIDKWATSSSTKLQEKINQLENGEEKDKLIKRKANWEKVKNSLVYVKQFLTGAGIGFSASGLAMGVVGGGHGLLWNKPEILTPGGLPASSGGTETSIGSAETHLGGAESSGITTPETYAGNSFIHDGHVDLPGSAWDGNLAGAPGQDILPGGAENFSNYAGGQYEMAASRLGEDLASYRVTDNLLSNLATPDKHQLLNQYLRAIQSGNTNPDLIEALKGMNSEGATKLLQALGQ